MSETKTCSKCGIEKKLREFSPNISGKLGRTSHCRKCRRDRWGIHADEINSARRKEYKNDPEKRARLARATAKYREKKKPELAAHQKKRYREIRVAVLEKYGGVCNCCKESRFEFLAIDHVNGRGHGALDRKINGGSTGVYRMLHRTEGKIPGYRVLCHNCNTSIGFYGYCPHQAK